MKNITKKFISTLAAVCLLTSTAKAASQQMPVYFGADLLYSKIKFKEEYGGNIFSKKFTPGINLFVGSMFNNNFGAEIGYEFYKNQKRSNILNVGDFMFGYKITNTLRYVSFNSTIKQQNIYLAGVAKTSISDNINVGLILGGELSRIRGKSTIVDNGLIAITPNVNNFSKTKLIPIVKASLEHKINNDFNIRVLASWKNTSRFKIRSEEIPGMDFEARLKDSFGLGVGFVYHI